MSRGLAFVLIGAGVFLLGFGVWMAKQESSSVVSTTAESRSNTVSQSPCVREGDTTESSAHESKGGGIQGPPALATLHSQGTYSEELANALNSVHHQDEASGGSTTRFLEIVLKLHGEGAPVVPNLVRMYHNLPTSDMFERGPAVIAGLTAVGNEEAKNALLELSLAKRGRYAYGIGDAALGYLRLASTAEEKATLLTGNATAREYALGCLQGERLSVGIVAKLVELFGVDSPYMGTDRNSRSIQVVLSRVLSEDLNQETLIPRVDAVLAICAELARSIRSGNREGFGWERDLHGPLWQDEDVYRFYLCGIGKMVGVQSILRERLLTEDGDRNKTCLVGLGFAGDTSVHGALLNLIKHEENGIFRSFSVEALANIAVAGDTALLEQLSRNDPFAVTDGQGLTKVTRYLVREAAKTVLERQRRRTAEE